MPLALGLLPHSAPVGEVLASPPCLLCGRESGLCERAGLSIAAQGCPQIQGTPQHLHPPVSPLPYDPAASGVLGLKQRGKSRWGKSRWDRAGGNRHHGRAGDPHGDRRGWPPRSLWLFLPPSHFRPVFQVGSQWQVLCTPISLQSPSLSLTFSPSTSERRDREMQRPPSQPRIPVSSAGGGRGPASGVSLGPQELRPLGQAAPKP